MSNSKVLTKMWRDMKGNFEAMLHKAKVEDKLPSRKDLMDHQESVQDLIDIFVTISSTSSSKTPQVMEVDAKKSSGDKDSEKLKSGTRKDKQGIQEAPKLARRVFSQEDVDYLWALYVENHMQYLSREQIGSAAKDLDRTSKQVQYHLRKLVAAHRNVSMDCALDNAFAASEDALIWERYTSRVADSYGSEGSIVKGLGGELRRPSAEVRNRLLWLKAQQNHKGNTATTSTTTNKRHDKRSYSDRDNAIILQVCEDQTMTHKELAAHLGRSKHGVLSQYYRLKQARDEGSLGGAEKGGAEEVPLKKVKREPGLPSAEEESDGEECVSSQASSVRAASNTNSTNNKTPSTAPMPYAHSRQWPNQRYSPQEDEIIVSAGLHPFRTPAARFEEVGALLGRTGSAIQKHVLRLFEERRSAGSGSASDSGGDNSSEGSESSEGSDCNSELPSDAGRKGRGGSYSTSSSNSLTRHHTAQETPHYSPHLHTTSTVTPTERNRSAATDLLGGTGGSAERGCVDRGSVDRGSAERDGGAQWFEDGRFSDRNYTAQPTTTHSTHYTSNYTTHNTTPSARTSSITPVQLTATPASVNVRRKRAADFMDDAF